MPTERPLRLAERAARYSATQRRTIATALRLFARHGVAGTSFQMIAEDLGITKAAVYHQFRAKDALVLAVLEVELEPLETALADARRSGVTDDSRQVLLDRVLDSAVRNRSALTTLQHDPVLFRLIGEDEAFRSLFEDLFNVLLGGDNGEHARVRAAVVSAAIGAVAHPFVAGVGDAALRDELVAVTRALLLDS